MNILSAKNIIKNYDGHLALDSVSIDVAEGSIFGLLGPNGAGKTTLIRIINQITKPDSGELSFMGRPAKENDVQHIGYLPEERGLYKKMKVGEQALYLARLKGVSKNDALKNLKYWFEKFEIENWWGKRIEELSKGMAQKIQFITTVIHQPKLLIFDEPFSGFDPINTNLIKNEILNLKKNGTTIIFSAHNMASVEEICDHVALINCSKKVLDGNIYDIKEQFKEGKYTIEVLANNDTASLLDKLNMDIIEQKEVGKNIEYTFKGREHYNKKDLLNQLNENCELFSFKELVPSMNDIFINVVEQTKSN